jgi:hypothetical protein
MPRFRKTSGKPNLAALCLSASSLFFIVLSFDPAPAGEDIAFRVSRSSDVPLPPGTSAISAPGPIITESSINEAAVASASNRIVLSNNEAIEYCLLMLQDGARFIGNVDAYSVVFNKRERLNGDLGDAQTIEMKVRHAPSFGVYMKWKNGDTGRQLLYSDEYEDKKMVVKLGGIKGRLLKGIKLDPTSSEAMAEARYPCTEAGLLGMIRQVIAHRENDLKHGQGVTCLRLENRMCDERDCYCFMYEYESPAFNPMYRKSFIMIDTRYHIPLQVINYTWLTETEGLSAAEIDEQSLVEDYSFSRIDFGRQLIGAEFQRDNPAYKM